MDARCEMACTSARPLSRQRSFIGVGESHGRWCGTLTQLRVHRNDKRLSPTLCHRPVSRLHDTIRPYVRRPQFEILRSEWRKFGTSTARPVSRQSLRWFRLLVGVTVRSRPKYPFQLRAEVLGNKPWLSTLPYRTRNVTMVWLIPGGGSYILASTMIAHRAAACRFEATFVEAGVITR